MIGALRGDSMNKRDPSRDGFMLQGLLKNNGYDWWWHSFTGTSLHTGEEKSFFIEFFACNPGLGNSTAILGQSIEHQRKHIPPSYVMVKAGWWGEDATQLHGFTPWSSVKIQEAAPFYILTNHGYCSEHTTYGELFIAPEEVSHHPEFMCDAGSMSWNLTIYKQIAFNVGYGASKPFRKLNAFEMFWHAEGMKTEYEGTVIANGEEYIVTRSDSYGYADKKWGSNFTSPWLWLSSNDLYSKIYNKRLTNSVFDIGRGTPRVFRFRLNRQLLCSFYYQGKNYEFNFYRFWTLAQTRFKCVETDTELIWYIKMENMTALLKMKVICKKKDMLRINYEAPNGEKKYNNLWNGGTGKGALKLYKKRIYGLELIDEVLACHVGCEYGEMD